MGAQEMRLSMCFIGHIFFAIVGPVKCWTTDYADPHSVTLDVRTDDPAFRPDRLEQQRRRMLITRHASPRTGQAKKETDSYENTQRRSLKP